MHHLLILLHMAPVIPLKFFDPPFFFTHGKSSLYMSYEGDSDSLWRVVLHKFFLLGLPWLKYLFGAKEKHDFWPHKSGTFFRAMWGDFIVYSGSSRPVLQESYPMSMIPHTLTLWHPVNNPHNGRIENIMSYS